MYTYRFSVICKFLFLGLVLMLSGPQASADVYGSDILQPKFSVTKRLCLGHLAGGSNADACNLETIVAADSPVSYVFIVENPWGEPPQLITLEDNYPNGFVPDSAAVCTDNQGANVPLLSGFNSPIIAQFNLDIGRTVTCVVNGEFTASGTHVNTVEASNSAGYSLTSKATARAVSSQPSGVDLSVSKSVDPVHVDLTTTGYADFKYNIIVKNEGPSDVFVGDHFTLHDRLSLLPDSIPFRVEILSASCTSSNSLNTDCLDPGDLEPYGTPEILIGTMGVGNFFKWPYSGGKGNLANGEHIKLEFEVRVRAIEGIRCVVNPNANGIRNTAFFTLISDSGTALTEANPANNTGTADLKLTTGYQVVDPNCGKGHLKVTKTQTEPDPASKTPWDTNVAYKITVQNVSVPAQNITINLGDLQDWVTEGLNTPPFTRKHVNTNCSWSDQSGLCSIFNGNLNADPDQDYVYYTQTERAWKTGQSLTLQPGKTMRLETTFNYADPDCETVPAAKKKPIINTLRVKYKATEYGAPNTSGPYYIFNQSDSAETRMRDQPPCKFRVEKTITDPTSWGGVQMKFGQTHTYKVLFHNDGPARSIGTVMDAIRLTKSNYSDGLTYTSSWTCTDSGVSNYVASGNIPAGIVRYTATPAQGSHAIQVRPSGGSAIEFSAGGILKCAVQITLNKPPYGSRLCSSEQTLLENTVLMDVTYPFNPNIHWAPSGSYSPGSSITLPTPQDKNWAIANTLLPRCIDGMVNKEGSVTGLPGTSNKWNYAGGPDINWDVTVTNTATSGDYEGSGNSTWNGIQIVDDLSAPYLSSPLNNPVCTPSSACIGTPSNTKKMNLYKLGSQSDMSYTFDMPGTFQNNQDVENCAKWTLSGSYQPSYGTVYTNHEYPVPVGSYDDSPYINCQTIPIIPTTEINITKQIDDQTGSGITTGGPFDFKVTCSPYELFAGTDTISIDAGQTGTVKPVPVRSTCTIAETSKPPVPQSAINACANAPAPMTAEWAPVSFSPSGTLNGSVSNPLSLSPHNVTATNTLQCVSVDDLPEYTDLRILKRMGGMGKDNWDFSFNVNCTPFGALHSSVSITIPDNNSALASVPVGSTCTVEEILPTTFPQSAIDHCNSLNRPGPGGKLGLVPVWEDPVYSPAQSYMVGIDGHQIIVRNKWKCALKTATSGHGHGQHHQIGVVPRPLDPKKAEPIKIEPKKKKSWRDRFKRKKD